jgi:hypothetical protein
MCEMVGTVVKAAADAAQQRDNQHLRVNAI